MFNLLLEFIFWRMKFFLIVLIKGSKLIICFIIFAGGKCVILLMIHVSTSRFDNNVLCLTN